MGGGLDGATSAGQMLLLVAATAAGTERTLIRERNGAGGRRKAVTGDVPAITRGPPRPRRTEVTAIARRLRAG